VSVFVAVPVKDLASAKQRLIPGLGPDQRRRLARAMLEDVLRALASVLAGSVFVVTRDDEVMEVAKWLGASCLAESENRGHTQAVALAQREAVASGAERFLTIPGDVPCVTPAEVERVLGGLGARRGALFVPSASGLGTNAALLSPPDAMPLTFGEPSFDNHLEAARQRGLAPAVLVLPGLGLDIDAPEDLALLLEQGPQTASAALVRQWRAGQHAGGRAPRRRRA
jgi:2-phospho-L-lactate guanylyltransferase